VQIDANLVRIQLINFDEEPDPDFYLMWMRIQVTKMMLIHNTGCISTLPFLFSVGQGADPEQVFDYTIIGTVFNRVVLVLLRFLFSVGQGADPEQVFDYTIIGTVFNRVVLVLLRFLFSVGQGAAEPGAS
jgi:hypothetical protein